MMYIYICVCVVFVTAAKGISRSKCDVMLVLWCCSVITLCLIIKCQYEVGELEALCECCVCLVLNRVVPI